MCARWCQFSLYFLCLQKRGREIVLDFFYVRVCLSALHCFTPKVSWLVRGGGDEGLSQSVGLSVGRSVGRSVTTISQYKTDNRCGRVDRGTSPPHPSWSRSVSTWRLTVIHCCYFLSLVCVRLAHTQLHSLDQSDKRKPSNQGKYCKSRLKMEYRF